MNQNNRQQSPQRPSGLSGSVKPSISDEDKISLDGSKKGTTVKKHIDRLTAAKIPFLFLTFVATVLAVALIFKIMSGSSSSNTASVTVDKTKYQAVFLNNNQVYFGKVSGASSRDLSLEDIYYIQVNGQNGASTAATTAQSQNITLVKLGCEIHGPQDKMLINRDQVLFWENLKDDGQVVQKIKENQAKGAQNCSTQSNSTGSSNNTSNATQSSTAPTQATTSTTPATTNTQTTTTPATR